MFLELLIDPQVWIGLIALTAMGVVLGVDNIFLLAVLADRLPAKQRMKAWRLGVGFALVTHLILLGLFSLTLSLSEPVFGMFGHIFSWYDIILIAGGLFLFAKATHEIHGRIEGDHHRDIQQYSTIHATFGAVMMQAIVLDAIFSLDFIVIAVGMTNYLWVMFAAMILSVMVMLLVAESVVNFVSNFPTIKMLVLSFMLLIGVFLVANGFGLYIPKGYIYFAMGFALAVEGVNLLLQRMRLSAQQRSLQKKNPHGETGVAKSLADDKIR